MIIGGIQKTSLIDYPDKISTVVFTQGCNFRCGFCHNKELVISKKTNNEFPEKDVLAFLKKRQSIIEAVVITGGEPTLQKDLIPFIIKIKDLGFFVKLDTNGSNPSIIKKLLKLKLLDYIAMDIKAPFSSYQKLTNSKIEISNIKKSISLIISSGINYEFRTTIMPFFTIDDIEEISKMIKGAEKYYLQNFRNIKTLEENFKSFIPKKKAELKSFIPILKQNIKYVFLR